MGSIEAAAAAPEAAGEAALFPLPDGSNASSPLSELDDELQDDAWNGVSAHRKEGHGADKIKVEGDDSIAVEDATTRTTLHPAPSPSLKRRESEVRIETPEVSEHANNKKRKRGSSPPWHFPTAEATTLKTADGRRISARVNASESDDRARSSSSVSVPPSARLRPESPPWRKFAAEGPTSVLVDGKRMSGRVNKELAEPPKRVSPRSKKTGMVGSTAGKQHSTANAARAGHATINGTGRTGVPQEKSAKDSKSASRPSTASDSASKIAELRAQIEALKPTRSFPSPEAEPERPQSSSHKRKHSHNNQHTLVQLDGSPSSPPRRMQPSSGKASSLSADKQRPSPKIKLRFTGARYAVPPPHPHATFPSPVKPPSLSIFQIIEQHELLEMQQPYTENERGPPDMAWFVQRAERQAVEEGAMRKKILQEAEPGGKLSREKLSIYQDVETQAEPPKQHAHVDHLVAHALHLRHLQLREKMHHRALAKKVAHEALEFWKAKRGPTEEDLREEQDKIFRLIYKQVVADVKAKWEMVHAHVQQQRLRAWEAEEELRRQARLQEKLEWSENMVARQRGEADTSDDDTGGGDSGDEGSEEESSGEENMSDESSEVDGNEEDGEEGGAGGEMGEEELRAYLAQRREDSPDAGDEHDDVDTQEESEDEQKVGDISMVDVVDSGLHTECQYEAGDVSMADLLGDAQEGDVEEPDEEFEPVADEEEDPETENPTDTERSLRRSRRSSATPAQDNEAEFSSDESTDMDSTDYDSDDDMSSTGEEDDIDDDDDDERGNQESTPVPKNSLLSLFKDEVKAIGLPTPTTSAEGDEEARAGAVAEPDIEQRDVGAHEDHHLALDEVNDEDTVLDDATQREASAAAGSSVPVSAPQSPDAESQAETPGAKNFVPSPALLRGTLRSYQHAGLDWLASLYRNGTNGILADEMGLGKTIQTIALLAHLAEEHGCWDPHLIIVPTSVVLNWVTEFQKFLPAFRVLGYYGSAEERLLKRKGWTNDPHHESKDKRGYNVVITSYNVAVADMGAIRNVSWHYLVLDEAHNIRNFNSQRWQTLIRLRTRARLLLTGTPLQNSLTELWSLLTFLTAGDDDPQHGDLEEFLSHWKEPIKEIFDRGVQTLSSEAQKVVDQLHVSLRPFLLRRLKSEVEKDLPKKTESVVVCKLSKRQRQLYQDYMGLAETKRSLTHGNAVTAGKVLLSLRRVCNHPDLFDPRPIQTSFGMELSALESFAVKEAAVRRLLGVAHSDVAVQVTRFEGRRRFPMTRAKQLDATARLKKEIEDAEMQSAAAQQPDATTLAGCQALQRFNQRKRKLEHLRSCIRISEESFRSTPMYGSDLRERLTIHRDRPYRFVAKDIRGRVLSRHLRGWPALGRRPLRFDMEHVSDWELSKTSMLQQSVETAESYAEQMKDTIVRFTFCTPVATAPVLDYAIPARAQQVLRSSDSYPMDFDYAHEARIRTSIAFPDARLLVYDAGKLQRLTRLLRDLQSRGSRSLIFTQMTGTLNILEQFLSLMNLPYLRLDGSTSIEHRQLYSAEFNRPDSKYQCMILSSRAGGVGLNLVGASSVIFYDLDWNPQMDRQCMDRAHRIGQVRDVEVYKMVSEKTVEENILRRANQKSLLDQTVIQEGHFTTEYQRQQQPDSSADQGDEDVAAAIERFFGDGSEKATNQALESVEDREDVQAAQQARKEEHQDDADFADRSSKGPSVPPTPGHGPDDDEDDERKGHVDYFMIRQMEFLLLNVPFVPPQVRRTDRHGRDRSHRKQRKR